MSKECDGEITRILIEQFSLICDMYEEAIEKIPEIQWRSGEIDYLIPARLILHANEAADYYTTDSSEGYLWNKRFEADPEKIGDIKPGDLPPQKVMLEYHREVRGKIEGWLRGMSEDDLLKAEEKFPWTGSTVLSRMLYILAHYRQHFGEVNAELRMRGLPRIKWRSLRK
ncbi:hypothetical protein A3K78_10505 [Candidatus Bathyarchaeota archaeon RBG_13_52_12]|nr:MAG: hypothetical protein A3K78_10505 [Candidatus Bathyarchaeota archaeon RBG_13_52_12]